MIEPRLLAFSIATTRTSLYYFRRDDKALYALPFVGGAPKKIGTLLPFHEGVESLAGFTVSPDDRRIVWTVGSSRDIDLELIADFR